MEQDDFLRFYLETKGYKENLRLMTHGMHDWRVFLAERTRKTQGNLSKGEMVFWGAFFSEPEVGIVRIKQWIAWCKEKGTIGQQAYAVISEKKLKKYLNIAIGEPQHTQQRKEATLQEWFDKGYYGNAREVYAEAEKSGWLTIVDDYHMTWNGTRAQLAYFLIKLYNPDYQQTMYYKFLEEHFEIKVRNNTKPLKELHRAIDDCIKLRKNTKKWMGAIDNLFT